MFNFDNINIGESYDRNDLARMWGYQSRHAISRGVVTPSGTNAIVLFVTREKQSSLTQYNDYISGGYLYWEGEEKGASNRRIISSGLSGDAVHLFYRERHHSLFTYMGTAELESYLEHTDAPMEAVFRILGMGEGGSGQAGPDFPAFTAGTVTSRTSIVASRVGQGVFRQGLVKLWGNCALTGVDMLEVLVASHIKPWKSSDDRERLDPYNGLLLSPTLDSLFDKGYISFQNSGAIIISKKLTSQQCSMLNITPQLRLRKIYGDNLPYLGYHRDTCFKG